MNSMRIGAFSKKYGVKVFTVRHYIEKKLLLTEKQGAHYVFSEADCKDMELILRLRSLSFSLTEILEALTFARMSNPSTQKLNRHLFQKMKLHFSRNQKSIEQLKNVNKALQSAMQTIQSDASLQTAGRQGGLCSDFIDILACPLCGSLPELTDVTLRSSQLLSGKVNCSCGYQACIRNGIYIDENVIRDKQVFGLPMVPLEKYLKCVTAAFINHKYRGMHTLAEALSGWLKGDEIILEMDFCCGFFFSRFEQFAASSLTYLFVNHDLALLEKQKAELENHVTCAKMFFCCDYDRLPFRKDVLDVIIDREYTKDHARDYDAMILESAVHHLKSGGLVAGLYPYGTTPARESTLLGRVMTKDYVPNWLMGEGFRSLFKKALGPVHIPDSIYHQDIANSEITQLVYIAQKSESQ